MQINIQLSIYNTEELHEKLRNYLQAANPQFHESGKSVLFVPDVTLLAEAAGITDLNGGTLQPECQDWLQEVTSNKVILLADGTALNDIMGKKPHNPQMAQCPKNDEKVVLLADSTGITDLTGTSLDSEYLKRVPLKIYTEAVTRLLPKISGSALKIFFALGSKLGSESNIVEIPAAELEAITNLSKQTVREGLNELQSLQLITRIGPNVRRKYLLNEAYLRRCK